MDVVVEIAGPWRDADDLLARGELRTGGAELDVVPVDAAFVDALMAGGEGRFGETERFAFAAARGVVRMFLSGGSLEESKRIVEIVDGVAALGGEAILVSPPQKAHTVHDWRALAREISRGTVDLLYYLLVRKLRSENDYLTCGMHLLGLRDLAVSAESEFSTAVQLLDNAGRWMIRENPPLRNAMNVVDRDGRHLVYKAEACVEFPAGSDEHNPLGVWRVVPISGTGLG